MDRDGVLNRRIIDGWVRHPGELEILPGVPAALARLARAGWRTVVVTNQRGIAVAAMSLEDVRKVHGVLRDRVAEAGGLLEEFYICPHDRDEGCPCRKPAPGLLDRADAVRAVDWPRSVLIGDSDSDIEAGKARGVRTIKVAGPSAVGADEEVVDLLAAVDLLV